MRATLDEGTHRPWRDFVDLPGIRRCRNRAVTHDHAGMPSAWRSGTSQAMELVGNLVGRMLHSLRRPLGLVGLSASLASLHAS